MHSNFIIYVDFDSTLYNTPEFADDLSLLIAKAAGLDAETVRKDSSAFHSHPVLGGYSFDDHIAAYGLEPIVMWSQLESLARESDYLYADSPGFIQSLRRKGFNPKILSFGENRFQITKINPQIPRLIGTEETLPLEAIVVDEKKREHIAKLHQGERGVLIDDIPNQQLPEGFIEIHLDRSSDLSEPLVEDKKYTVANLSQAEQVINLLADI
jgi:hypothetical protein